VSFTQSEKFNANCSCKTINEGKLGQLEASLTSKGDLPLSLSKFYSPSPTSISKTSLNKIENFLQVFQTVLQKERVKSYILRDIPKEYMHRIGSVITGGIFLGFDFHDTVSGPKLIEINTNAGGLLINSVLYEVQENCCSLLYSNNQISDFTKAKEHIFKCLHHEWRLNSNESQLKTVVILDETPEEQFLYPEFKLFQKIFEENGVKSWILAPELLHLENNVLYYQGEKIDLVYNRHTDFMLTGDNLAKIKSAWLSGNLCLTPNPIDYQIFANKRNLEVFSNRLLLSELGIDERSINVITEVIPETHLLLENNKDLYWQARKDKYFKPQNSFGSKGVYSGKKITKAKMEEISKLNYLAQTEVPPSSRKIDLSDFKIDYRVYAYNFDVLMLTSRLYRGQTTNFRTEGGGFSPVMEVGN
jgi:hypothetical protein